MLNWIYKLLGLTKKVQPKNKKATPKLSQQLVSAQYLKLTKQKELRKLKKEKKKIEEEKGILIENIKTIEMQIEKLQREINNL